MITIYLNNEKMEIEKHLSLADALAQLGYEQQHIAIAINRVVIPRVQHTSTYLNDNDIVQIVTPMQGG